MEAMRRELIVWLQVHVSSSFAHCIQEPHMCREIIHGLKLDTSSHAARSPWFLDLALINLVQHPDSVVRMTENPKVISAYIGELLEIGFVYPGSVQGFDEFMWGQWRSSDLGRKRSGCE
jgi:hypothetical protein